MKGPTKVDLMLLIARVSAAPCTSRRSSACFSGTTYSHAILPGANCAVSPWRLYNALKNARPRIRGYCAAPRHRPKETTVPHSLRFHAGPGPYSFIDLVHGPQVLSPANITGDFTVKRADGIFAYHLTVTVDDAAMDISLVVRGDDLLPVTAAHLELQAALGLPTPRYAHIPLLLDTLGRPLAKRRGTLSLSELRAKGVTAERVVGLLAYSLGILPKPMRLSAAEFKAIFTLNKISKSPHRLSPPELSWLLY